MMITELQQCTICSKLGPISRQSVEGFEKPSIEFNIYGKWKEPEKLNVVFIAEAPPGKSQGYFYNPLPQPDYKEKR